MREPPWRSLCVLGASNLQKSDACIPAAQRRSESSEKSNNLARAAKTARGPTQLKRRGHVDEVVDKSKSKIY
jgi:hypothetical protein